MSVRRLALALTSAVVASVCLSAQTPPSIDALVSSAKAAAGTDWQGTFTRLCVPPPPSRGGSPEPAASARALPPRETWHVEPAKVGDNFYFIGEKAHHSWALVGSDGIILIEALFDYMTADEVVGGMRKLGLDMNRDFVRQCQTPVLILPDDIPAHPYKVAMEAAMLAPKAEVSMFPWKEPKERIPLAIRQIRSFLRAHRAGAASA